MCISSYRRKQIKLWRICCFIKVVCDYWIKRENLIWNLPIVYYKLHLQLVVEDWWGSMQQQSIITDLAWVLCELLWNHYDQHDITWWLEWLAKPAKALIKHILPRNSLDSGTSLEIYFPQSQRHIPWILWKRALVLSLWKFGCLLVNTCYRK